MIRIPEQRTPEAVAWIAKATRRAEIEREMEAFYASREGRAFTRQTSCKCGVPGCSGTGSVA